MVNWDDRFIELAEFIAKWSRYPGRKVGAVIVGPKNEIRSTGYNGFPRGVNDHLEERYNDDVKYKWTEHAERNAIYNAYGPLDNCRMYLPWFPCMDCARAIVQCGIKELIANRPDLNDPDWGNDFKLALELFEETGVKVRWYKK
jgi:dCMP deaminase